MFDNLGQHDFLTQLFLVFLAGIGTSLTPCVYPLIPITLTLFGANDDCSRWRSFRLSLTFVAGIALTFTLLGILSATTGSLFGSALSHPAIIIVLGILLTILACTSLDIFHLSFFTTLQNKASCVGAKGFLGAFMAGTVAGVVASPCIGPVLVAILILVAQSGNVLTGAMLLLSFSLGLGLLFILLGTFSSLLNRIPRSGHWMNGVKFIIATSLFFFVFFLTQPLTSFSAAAYTVQQLLVLSWCTIAILSTVAYVGYHHQRSALRLAPSVLVAFLLFLLYVERPSIPTMTSGTEQHSTVGELQWHHDLASALEEAQKDKKLVFVDLYADWCVACKELDKITFSDPTVQTFLSHVVLAKIDFTTSTEETDRISEQYGVIGLPWLLTLNEHGQEIPDSTITGFVSPEEFLDHMKKVIPPSDNR